MYDAHRSIRYFLGLIVRALRQVNGGVLTRAQWYELAVSIVYFETAGATHTADEEESVFPRLRACRAARSSFQRITTLERDHFETRGYLRIIDGLVRRWLANGLLEPADRSNLRDSLIALEVIYKRHLAWEEKELFPLAQRVLSMRQIREIGREMVARRTGGDHPQIP